MLDHPARQIRSRLLVGRCIGLKIHFSRRGGKRIEEMYFGLPAARAQRGRAPRFSSQPVARTEEKRGGDGRGMAFA